MSGGPGPYVAARPAKGPASSVERTSPSTARAAGPSGYRATLLEPEGLVPPHEPGGGTKTAARRRGGER